jgi:hypothetical protein
MAETVLQEMVELMASTLEERVPTLAKTARMGHPTSKAKL